MPKTTDIGDLPVCRTNTVAAGCARLVSAAAKAGVAATLAVGLFGLSPYVPPAHATDLQVQTGTSASLVFSPINVALSPPDTLNQWFVNLCATNYSSVTVDVGFIIQVPDFPQYSINYTGVDILPHQVYCVFPYLPYNGGSQTNVTILAQLVLKAPAACSQATQYPGNCRVLGSLEIGLLDENAFLIPHIHSEPVLLPGTPGPPLPTFEK
jgi:hypothetical protein